MSLEADLHAIWSKYKPQRDAERDALARDKQAREELIAFNERRSQLGLRPVDEYRESHHLSSVGNFTIGPPPKTWRDELDAEILVAVKKHFATT